MLNHIEPHSARKAVENIADGFIDIALSQLIDKTAESVAEVVQDLADEPIDDASAYPMTLADQVRLLENHGDDADVFLDDLTLDNLRSRIEAMSCLVIHQLAQQVAESFFSILEEVMDEHDLGVSQMTESNEFGWAVHRAERDEGEHCTVYEYRDADECNVDVWHFFRGSWDVYFNEWIDPEDNA